jgi:hypothetical protein
MSWKNRYHHLPRRLYLQCRQCLLVALMVALLRHHQHRLFAP